MSSASLAHLYGRLMVVEDRVRTLVARRRETDPEPEDRFRGLHVSDAQVDRLVAGPLAGQDPDLDGRLAPLEAVANRGEAEGEDLRLRRLARSFGLDALEVELLVIALAPDLDRRFEPLYGYLQDDVSRRRAGIGLCFELCGIDPASAGARARLSPGGALVDCCLVTVEEEERPFLTRSLRVPDRVCAFLLGDDRPDAAVLALAVDCEPAPGGAAGLARWAGAGHPLAYVREQPGTAGAPLAAAALAAAGRAALVLDLARLDADGDLAGTAALVAREARLCGAGIVAGPVEALASRGSRAVQAFTELARAQVVLVGAASWDPAWSRRVPLLCEAPAPDGAERAALWRAGVNGTGAPGLDPAAATAQFRLTPEQVRRATLAAQLHAYAAGRPIEEDDLRAGARLQNAAGLERLARRIEPSVTLADLVLPPDVLDQLVELRIRARRRERVLKEWRMGGSASRRTGLSALFAGASGTGKTMAAEALAAEMGLDLYVVDLASVVDKYIGETEKNLDRIFAEAERVNGVLLFDEADALFGKRSEIADAHDRYANVEVAYLLQRMELFDGMALLATNLRSNLDEAFARRLDALIDFPEPEEEDRLLLWDRCLGPLVPRADDLDLAFLARAFKLSGGNIRNIAVAAAYFAADEDRPVRMADLVRATGREYRKLGRMVVESEFAPYFALL
jgi:ATPase family associated with various cellular activities (AAA)